MVQRCASDASYTDDLMRRRYEPHVSPINSYIDELKELYPWRYMPYVAPTYGGTDARLFALHQDPGPMTNPENGGTGMLCIDNPDKTAARYKDFLERHGIAVGETQSWNAYPWYLDHGPGGYGTRQPTESGFIQGIDVLNKVLSMLQKVEVVMLHGRKAQTAWGRLMELGPESRNIQGITVIRTFHTSPRVVDPRKKAANQIEYVERNLDSAFERAARHLRTAR